MRVRVNSQAVGLFRSLSASRLMMIRQQKLVSRIDTQRQRHHRSEKRLVECTNTVCNVEYKKIGQLEPGTRTRCSSRNSGCWARQRLRIWARLQVCAVILPERHCCRTILTPG